MLNSDLGVGDGPVLVTGATGYVAGWIVRLLLERGVRVHAAVRDSKNAAKRAHLDVLARRSPGEVRYFDADLTAPGSYASAMQGCKAVFHTASPFALAVDDPQRDLVDPALLGTRNVLEEVDRTRSVERVVVTSSAVAIFGDNVDVESSESGLIHRGGLERDFLAGPSAVLVLQDGRRTRGVGYRGRPGSVEADDGQPALRDGPWHITDRHLRIVQGPRPARERVVEARGA